MADHTDTRRATGASPGSTPGSDTGAPRAGTSMTTTDDGTHGDTRRVGEDARGEARRMKEDAKARAQEVKEKARTKARELTDDARERVRGVRDEAEQKAQRWTANAGERTSSLARALHAASESLRDEGEPGMADMAGRAAEQVDRMSGYLEDEDPSAMLHDLEDMGRRHPGTFVGSTFAMGMILGRFLRSSSPRDGDGISADGGPAGGTSGAYGSSDVPGAQRYTTPRTGPTYGSSDGGRPGADVPSPAQRTGAGATAGARVDTPAGRPGSRSPASDEQGDYPAGASRPTSGTAPASAGETVGSRGTINATGGPDIRPSSDIKNRPAEHGTSETPVRSPSGGASSGPGVRTGSAGAASRSAGSGVTHGGGQGPAQPPAGRPPRDSTRREGPNAETRGVRAPQSSGTPTPGTGARTGPGRKKEENDDER